MKLNPIMSILAAGAVLISCSAKSGGNTPASEPTTPTEARLPEFSADSAYRHVVRQVEFGPRVPGTDAHCACADYIAESLRSAGADVTFQDTLFAAPGHEPVAIHNIIGRFNHEAQRQVMLLAHYDTRPWADEDPDPKAHKTPIDGANDGASGVGVILEIARLARSLPPTTGLTLLLVDQEDAGETGGDDATWCLGSQAWAAALRPTDPKPTYAILLDMVGGRNALFHPEYFSANYAPSTVDRVWRTAAALGYANRFPTQIGGAVNDDHIALLRAGIPAIDIIETQHPETGSFNPSWHTLDDNIDNIDPTTLKIVGDVVWKTISK